MTDEDKKLVAAAIKAAISSIEVREYIYGGDRSADQFLETYQVEQAINEVLGIK